MERNGEEGGKSGVALAVEWNPIFFFCGRGLWPAIATVPSVHFPEGGGKRGFVNSACRADLQVFTQALLAFISPVTQILKFTVVGTTK